MTVTAIRDNFQDAPEDLLALGYSQESQVNLTVGQDYEVHAISLWRKTVFLQIIDDTQTPTWMPKWLFRSEAQVFPTDWVCSLFNGEPELVIGPEFLAKTEESYKRMVELERESVEEFWKRIALLVGGFD